jgi:hypothetical protein
MDGKLLIFSLISVILLIFTVCITNIKPVLADVNDNVTIDVNVSISASITVLPDVLNWTSVIAGTASLDTKNLTIKNTGSINVSNIYAYVDTLITEPVRPYGLASSKNYSAGGVIALKNETDANSQFFLAGRIEWNWTQDIPNHDWTHVGVTNAVAWGYFRNTSNEYVWVVGNGTDGQCLADTKFAIEDDRDIGTLETRSPDDASITLNANDSTWAYFSVDRATAPLNFSCVAVYNDCTKIYIYNYDRRANFDDCASANNLFSGNLVPGYSFITLVSPWVPLGYPAGFLNTTTLTFYATST